MAIDIITKALYPLVPKVAGVPAVLRAGAQVFDTLTLGFLGVGDLVNSIIGSEPILWGVFKEDGSQISDYDSVVSVDYREDSRISDYPIEEGSFASFNKVQNPFSKQVLLSCGGSLERRAAFQVDLRSAQKSLTLYTVITEDGTFQNCNLVGIDWARANQDGAHIIKAYCEFREVRIRGTTAFSQTQDPSGANPQSNGQVQAIDDSIIDTSGFA
jgi:hypothetical protein